MTEQRPDFEKIAKELAEALNKIKNLDMGCGCVPCTGQCRDNEAMAEMINEFKDVAKQALQKYEKAVTK